MIATTSLAPPRTHWSGIATDAELARWDAVAEAVAETLGADALARDRANAQPFAEARLLQDAALTTLLDPVEFGGGGAHWETAARVVRIIARRDASIAQLLGYHYINEANIALVAAPDERERWFRSSIDGRWIWGDSVNPVDPNLTLTVDGDGYRLDGFKRYSTGSGVGEALLINAVVEDGPDAGAFAYLVLPHGHPGVELVDDWDNLGQRLSASNTVTYRNVRVDPEHVLGFGTDEPIQSFVTPGIQLMFGNLYLGIAEGALAQARDLTVARPNAWFLSEASTYRDDPFVRRLYGELVSKTAAVSALADRVNRRFDETIALGADVVVDNFRVGTMARFGLDRESLASERPDLVTCSITGFGSTGAGARLAGYDFLVQAMSGVMAITGEADGEPTKIGSAMVDNLTGLYAVIAILAAVEERSQTGRGQHVEVSLMGAGLAGLLNVGSGHVVADTDPARQGNRHPSIVPYQPYRTADGVLAIAAASPALWEKFCVLLGRDGWLADDRFVNNGSRMLHADELEAEVEAVLATDSTDAWLERLRVAGIPAGLINTVRGAFLEAAELGLDPVDVLDDGAGEFRSVRSPIRMSATPPTVRRRPPTNDQHGAEIRAELDS